jgi:hypothetical protein
MGLLGAARKIPITGNSSERKLDIPPVRTRGTSFVSKHRFLRFSYMNSCSCPKRIILMFILSDIPYHLSYPSIGYCMKHATDPPPRHP